MQFHSEGVPKTRSCQDASRPGANTLALLFGFVVLRVEG